MPKKTTAKKSAAKSIAKKTTTKAVKKTSKKSAASKKTTKKSAAKSIAKKTTKKTSVKKSSAESSTKKTSATTTKKTTSTAASKKVLPTAPPEQCFWTTDGQVLASLADLAVAFGSMDDSVFLYHANEERNDFADWVEHVCEDKVCAKELRRCEKPRKARTVVVRHLKFYRV